MGNEDTGAAAGIVTIYNPRSHVCWGVTLDFVLQKPHPRLPHDDPETPTSTPTPTPTLEGEGPIVDKRIVIVHYFSETHQRRCMVRRKGKETTPIAHETYRYSK